MADYEWDDFPSYDGPITVEDDTARAVTVRINGVRYHELPDNGWQLLFAWIAGPQRVVRAVDRKHHTVTRTFTPYSRGTAGRAHSSVHPWTQDDQKDLDDTVNSYLADAGVGPRPSGFVWYLQLPENLPANEMWRAVVRGESTLDNPQPAQVRDVMAEVVERLYSGE